jgi:hypothetical protein
VYGDRRLPLAAARRALPRGAERAARLALASTLAVLRHVRGLPNAALADELAAFQARLAVPVLALTVALAVRPLRPQRDLPAAGQAALAAAALVAVTAWHGDGPGWLPGWVPAGEPLAAVNRWLAGELISRSVPVTAVATGAGIVAMMLVATLAGRSVRSRAGAYLWLWTTLRVAVLALAAGWPARAGGLDPAVLEFGEQTYADFREQVGIGS